MAKTKRRHIATALIRHAIASDYAPYERILQSLRARGDIWIVPQGEYLVWWQRRENASLSVVVSDGVCRAHTSLSDAVIERFPGEFLETPEVPIPQADFSGEVCLTIDERTEHLDLLVELLRREGILNFRVAASDAAPTPAGSSLTLARDELESVLQAAHANLHQQRRFFEEDFAAVRQIVENTLAARGLPLLRVWYHPRVGGVVVRAVFSPRYDVDRAITNLARVRALERKYAVESTFYIRAFCPFYRDDAVRELVRQPWCPEIGLHGEFVTYARRYGGEVEAALAEKAHLEELIEHPVQGVCMHGGELTSNVSPRTVEAVEHAGFLYDTTPVRRYYFPFRRLVQGRLSQSYCLAHALSDISVPVGGGYARVFYETVLAMMDEIYQQNGVFVLTLHPEYFGFWNYLLTPRNWGALASFAWRYVGRRLQRGNGTH